MGSMRDDSDMSSDEYHPVCLLLDGREAYAILVSSATDHFVADDDGICWFDTRAALDRYAADVGLAPDEETAVYDLDDLARWTSDPPSPPPRALLDVWNLCTDLAASTPVPPAFHALVTGPDPLHEKLTYEAVPWLLAEPVEITWEVDEIEALRALVRALVVVLRSHLEPRARKG